MFVLTEAFADKTKESKQLYRECNYIQLTYLEKKYRKDYL